MLHAAQPYGCLGCLPETATRVMPAESGCLRNTSGANPGERLGSIHLTGAVARQRGNIMHASYSAFRLSFGRFLVNWYQNTGGFDTGSAGEELGLESA